MTTSAVLAFVVGLAIGLLQRRVIAAFKRRSGPPPEQRLCATCRHLHIPAPPWNDSVHWKCNATTRINGVTGEVLRFHCSVERTMSFGDCNKGQLWEPK